MLRRRTIMLSLLPALVAASAVAQTAIQLTPQDRADQARIEAYLNGITTLKAHFLQVAPNGQPSQGTVWLDRPGRMRFQYDPPAPYLLVASHGLLQFHDSQLKQISNISLSRTPLGILLAKNVRLSGDVTVTGIQQLPGQLQITLVRTDSPGEGSLTLVFADDPLALRQWVTVDAQQQATRVTLYNVELGINPDPSLFDLVSAPINN